MEHKPEIDTKLLEHLAELARIDLDEDKDKLLHEFSEIVTYFEKLSKLNVEKVKPMSGGTFLESVFRKDVYDDKQRLPRDKAVQALPEKQDGYLRVPPVFEE